MSMGSDYITNFYTNDGTFVQVGELGNFNGNVDDYVSGEINGDFPKTTKAPTFISYASLIDKIPVAPSVLGSGLWGSFVDGYFESMEEIEHSLAEGGEYNKLVTDLYWLIGSPLTGGLAIGYTGGEIYILSLNGFAEDENGIHAGMPGTNSLVAGSPTITLETQGAAQTNVAPIVPPAGTYSKGLAFYDVFRYDNTLKSLVFDGFSIDVTSIHNVAGGYMDTGADWGDLPQRHYWTTVGEFIERSWNWNYTDVMPSLLGQVTFYNERKIQFEMPEIEYPGSSIMGPFPINNGTPVEGTSFFGGEVTDYESDNPYKEPGSGPGGGFGDQNRFSQDTLPEGIPSLDLLNSGFVKLYNPTKVQLSDFAQFLFSSITESMSAVFKRMISNPLDYIISLHMIHLPLHSLSASNIGFCGISSGVAANEVDKQYYEIEYQLNINEFWQSALDYTNYTKGKIYIPYCGIYDINIDEFMNGTMFLRYVIDCVSGACVAFLGTKRLQKDGQTFLRATLYQFNGNCILSMPVSSTNWQGVFQSIMSIATTAVAPGTSALSGMANDILGQKISVQKSGSLASNYGYLGKQKPYVIIERPELSMPRNYGKNFGFPANEYVLLGNCNGFTAIDTGNGIILDDIEGITPEEADELKTLLSNGVYFFTR